MLENYGKTLDDTFSWATSISRTRVSTIDGLSLRANSASDSISDFQGILRTVQNLKLKHIPYDALQEGDFIGEGETFSVVKHQYENKIIAVKFIKRNLVNDAESPKLLRRRLQSVMREILIMNHGPIANHPNVLDLLGYGWQLESGRPYPYVAVEYGTLGGARPFLKAHPDWPFRHRVLLAGDIASGLTALHEAGIIHGDLKLDNVVLFQTWDRPSACIAKICDFGHSITLTGGEKTYYYYGTPLYLPPEAFHQKASPISRDELHKCDMWAFGLALWEILDSGETYFRSEWYSSTEFSRSQTSTDSDTLVDQDNSDCCEENKDKPKSISLDGSEVAAYFGNFDLNHLQRLSQSVLRRACPTNCFQRSYLGPLLRLTLHTDPSQRISRFSRSPILNEWSKTAPKDALQAKLAVHTRGSELNYDMFRPERQVDIPWEHQVQIFEDFQSLIQNERQGTRLASACFQLMICYIVGFGCNIDYVKANQNLRRAIENDFYIARIFGDGLAAGLTKLPNTDDQDFASKLRSVVASQRSIDKTATLYYHRSSFPTDDKNTKNCFNLSAFTHHKTLLTTASDITGLSQRTIIKELCLHTGTLQPIMTWLEFAILMNDLELFHLCRSRLPRDALGSIGAWDETPLLLATRLGQYEMVRHLLLADTSGIQIPSCNILHWLFCLADNACECLDLIVKHCSAFSDLIQQMCTSKWSVHFQWPTELSGTPLAFAVVTGSRRLVQRLLRYGADPLAPALPPNDEELSSDWTAVHLATKYNQAEILADLLAHLEATRSEARGTYLQFPRLQLAASLSFLDPVERFGIFGSSAISRLGRTIRVLPRASLFWQSVNGATPLLQSIDFENLETVTALLDYHPRLAEVQISDPKDRASFMLPLHFATQICSRRGSLDAVHIPRRVLEAYPKSLSMRDDRGRTALHFSVNANFAEVTQFLILQGASINAYDELHRSPLLFCRSAANTTMLLQKGARISDTDQKGLNAAHHAVVKGDEAQLQLLIQNGIDINAADNDMATPLHYAISRCSKLRIEMLLKAGAHVNTPNDFGDTALHIAVKCNRIDVVRLLMSHGANINIINKSGFRPLTIALRQGSELHDFPIKVSRQMFEALFDVEETDETLRDGHRRLVETLHVCASEGNREIMHVFLEHPRVRGVIDINAGLQGKTALHTAARSAAAGVAQELLDRGADPNKGDNSGATPLHELCNSKVGVGQGARALFFKALWAKGADLSLSDHHSVTVWKLAYEQLDFEMMALLLQHTEEQEQLVENLSITQNMVCMALSLGNSDFVTICLKFAASSVDFLREDQKRSKLAEKMQCEDTISTVANALLGVLTLNVRSALRLIRGQSLAPGAISDTLSDATIVANHSPKIVSDPNTVSFSAKRIESMYTEPTFNPTVNQPPITPTRRATTRVADLFKKYKLEKGSRTDDGSKTRPLQPRELLRPRPVGESEDFEPMQPGFFEEAKSLITLKSSHLSRD